MKASQIAPGIHRIGANITNGDLFEGLWPIPDGVSLNSYVVKGEKTAIIDLVRDWDEAPTKIREQLASIPVDLKSVDYIVLNHMEPDHTGWLGTFREICPKAEIVATQKALTLVKEFYGIEDGLRAVKSGDSIDLGGGKKLVFEEIPNVHWPETMVTYEPSAGVLFSCAAFGSFGSVGSEVFDDELTPKQHEFYEKETLRYYANIVASFSVFVERAIAKLGGLKLNVIAPSHGILWRKDPGVIVNRYKRYAAFSNGPAEAEVAFVWGSMYGNTERLVDTVRTALRQSGVTVNEHRVPGANMSYILASAFKSTGLVLGMPTYEYRMFPPMAHVLDDLGRKKVFGKKVFRFGSFGWSGGAAKELAEITEKYKWDFLDPVEFQGAPKSADYEAVAARVKELAEIVKRTALPK